MNFERFLTPSAETSNKANEEEEENACHSDAPDGCCAKATIDQTVGTVLQALGTASAVTLTAVGVVAHDNFTVSELKLYYTLP